MVGAPVTPIVAPLLEGCARGREGVSTVLPETMRGQTDRQTDGQAAHVSSEPTLRGTMYSQVPVKACRQVCYIPHRRRDVLVTSLAPAMGTVWYLESCNWRVP